MNTAVLAFPRQNSDRVTNKERSRDIVKGAATIEYKANSESSG